MHHIAEGSFQITFSALDQVERSFPRFMPAFNLTYLPICDRRPVSIAVTVATEVNGVPSFGLKPQFMIAFVKVTNWAMLRTMQMSAIGNPVGVYMRPWSSKQHTYQHYFGPSIPRNSANRSSSRDPVYPDRTHVN